VGARRRRRHRRLRAGTLRPAFGSIVPEIVPRELLAQANSLDQFVRTAAGLVGPAIGGVVIAVSSAGVAFLIDAGTFAVSTGHRPRADAAPDDREEPPLGAARRESGVGLRPASAPGCGRRSPRAL
jgi:hypothetical protein